MLASPRVSRSLGDTDIKCFDFTTVVANSLQDFLDLGHETIVVDWGSKLDDSKVSGAFSHVLFTSVTSEVAIDCAEMRIVRTFLTRSLAVLIPATNVRSRKQNNFSEFYIQRLRILDVDHRETFGFFG